MSIEEVLAIITNIAIGVLIVVLYKLIFKKTFEGMQWIIPGAFPIGSILMWLTTSSDSYLVMLKEAVLFSFIIAMIYINIYFVIKGSKSSVSRGKSFWKNLKTEWNDNIKPTFKKTNKNSDDEAKTDEEKGDDLNDGNE